MRPSTWRLLPAFLVAICCIAAEPSPARGAVDLYAGISENQFSLLRDRASTAGYELGGLYDVLPWLAIDAGYAYFGRISGAFPLVAVVPPGTVTAMVYTPTAGTNSLHVDARAAYLVPMFRRSFGNRVSGSLGLGVARFETKIGSNLYVEGPTIAVNGTALPVTWTPEYSGTRRSWTGLGRASLGVAVSNAWTVELSAHFTAAPAITSPGPLSDIGNRRLRILGAALRAGWHLPLR